jgi:hypothetical protein
MSLGRGERTLEGPRDLLVRWFGPPASGGAGMLASSAIRAIWSTRPDGRPARISNSTRGAGGISGPAPGLPAIIDNKAIHFFDGTFEERLGFFDGNGIGN